MKRRHALQALLGTPVLGALAPVSGAEPQQPAEVPKLALTVAEAAADPAPSFFTPQQLGALRRLGDLLVPGSEKRPGARAAQAAEFLDFLLAQSAHPRRVLYRNGLDRLDLESGRHFSRRFEDLGDDQAATLMTPLEEPGNKNGPLAEFLWAAREDLLAATMNSREYAAAQTAAGRRPPGMGTYWYAIE